MAKQPTLDPRRMAFAEEYLKTSNAYQSALKAGYSEAYARVHSHELPDKPAVKAYLEARRKQMVRSTVTPERVLMELAGIGFADIADFVKVSANGAVAIVPTEEISPRKRAAIVGIKEGRDGIEIKLADKVRALELMGKNLGIFTPSDPGESDAVKQAKLLLGGIHSAID